MENKIKLSHFNGTILVFNADDWLKLRVDFRILGDFIGSNIDNPTLPVVLCEEEVALLLEKNIVEIISYPKISREPSLEDKEAFEKQFSEKCKQIKESYLNARKEELAIYAPQAISKRKELTLETFIHRELEKENVTSNNIITVTYREHPSYLKAGNHVSVPFEHTQTLNVCIFKDLWEKGFYVTSALKFGGDYLLYQGDPMCFHASYIVRVHEEDEELSLYDLIGFARLACSVKKFSVLATKSSNSEIKYISMKYNTS